MRVLLLAEAANPDWVSVPLVGWSHARAIADAADAHLVTQVRNAEAIERTGWVREEHFTALDTEKTAARVQRIVGRSGWTTRTAASVITTRVFERMVWETFGERIADGEFDVVHRLTPVSPTVPSPIATRCRAVGVPFVLGPLNGGIAWPREFPELRRNGRELLSHVRGLHKLMPSHRRTRRDAAAILVGSRETWRQLDDRERARAVYMPENAVDPERFDDVHRTAATDGPMAIAFVGRLVKLKGVDMLIDAAAPLLRDGRAVLRIIGDGDEREALEDQTRQAGLTEAVTFAGWVSHDELQHELARAHVFGFPSVKEFGGGAVLEAMACGAVPVVIDYGGPAELISPATGIAIPMGTREQIIPLLGQALEALCDDRGRLERMGCLARERVERQFTWPVRAQQSLKVYDWVCGRSDRPDFGMPLPDTRTTAAVPVIS